MRFLLSSAQSLGPSGRGIRVLVRIAQHTSWKPHLIIGRYAMIIIILVCLILLCGGWGFSTPEPHYRYGAGGLGLIILILLILMVLGFVHV